MVAIALGVGTGVTATDGAASAAVASGAPAANTVVGTSGWGSGWQGSWPPPGPKPHGPCTGAFHGPPRGSVQTTTSAGPNGSAVMPGQRITVTLTWKPSDFFGNRAFLSEDCVEIGPRPVVALGQVHFPAPSGGTDTFSYVVPQGGTGGQPICDRGVVAGSFDPQPGRGPSQGENGGSARFGAETSAILCYSILAADAPEASEALFFPLAALLVVGGAVRIAWRRRGSARATTLDRSDPGIG